MRILSYKMSINPNIIHKLLWAVAENLLFL